jgi:hypothetical protein
MRWDEFEEQAPDLAALGRERIEGNEIVLVGTVTKRGEPRISAVEPMIFEGQLLLGMMWQSRKALDLLRDPRILVHTVISKGDGTEGEFKVRGRAVDVKDPGLRERYANAVFQKIDWRPSEPYHLFAVDIEGAAFIRYGGEERTVLRWQARGGRSGENRKQE